MKSSAPKCVRWVHVRAFPHGFKGSAQGGGARSHQELELGWAVGWAAGLDVVCRGDLIDF